MLCHSCRVALHGRLTIHVLIAAAEKVTSAAIFGTNVFRIILESI
jgi:hypothetical protein